MKKLDILGDNAVSVCCSPDLCMPPQAVVRGPRDPAAGCPAQPSHTLLWPGLLETGARHLGEILFLPHAVPVATHTGVWGLRSAGAGSPHPTPQQILLATQSQFLDPSQPLTVPGMVL